MKSRFILLATCLILGACSTLNAQKTAKSESTETKTTNTEKAQKADFDQDKDTLYDLMVAEIAGQRNQLNITLVNYIHQARVTRDPEIIRRAINAAQYSKDLEAIREMGLLWAEVDPDSIPAHQLLAFQYSLQQMLPEAVHHIDRVIELGGNARVDSLAVGSQQLPDPSKEELLELYQELYKKYPDRFEIGYSIALVQRNLKQYSNALKTLDPLLEEREQFETGAILKSNILIELGDRERAYQYIEEQYENYPKSHTLGRLYAGLLIDQKQFSEAEAVFADLLQLYPKAPGLKLSHALVMLENDKVEAAKKELEELIAEGIHLNEGNFYLGRIADRKDDTELAIEHYSQVKEGIHFEPALERASFLLTQADKTQEAIDNLDTLREERPDIAKNLWLLQYKLLSTIDREDLAFDTLNQAIEAFPEDEQLLYARAMTYDEKDEFDKMETDLRTIIKINPKNAIAINALGYTLADKTDRTQEAFALITLALSLKPENPAIVDSMGWVLYRMGELEEALAFLLKAYQVYPDGEVAAHLGEVLWQLDKKEEAKIYWQRAYIDNPEHAVLISTLERLAPELLTQFKAAQAAAPSEQSNEEAANEQQNATEQ